MNDSLSSFSVSLLICTGDYQNRGDGQDFGQSESAQYDAGEQSERSNFNSQGQLGLDFALLYRGKMQRKSVCDINN